MEFHKFDKDTLVLYAKNNYDYSPHPVIMLAVSNKEQNVGTHSQQTSVYSELAVRRCTNRCRIIVKETISVFKRGKDEKSQSNR
jgi:hypothetical protein